MQMQQVQSYNSFFNNHVLLKEIFLPLKFYLGSIDCLSRSMMTIITY